MYINTALYKKSAEALHLPMIDHSDFWMIEIPLGKNRYFFWSRMNSFSIHSNVIASIDRLLANKILTRAKLPVAKMIKIKRDDFSPENWSLPALKFPIAIMRSLDFAYFGDSICNVKNQHSLSRHMKLIFEEVEEIVIEEFDPSLKSYNIFLFKNKIISGVALIPASVVGDGIHTIAQLIEIENEKRAPLYETIDIGPLKVDFDYKEKLQSMNLSLEHIPDTDERITLTHDSSPHKGGNTEAIDIKNIHQHIAQTLIKASIVLNLDCVSFNIYCKDISAPATTQPFFISPSCYPDISMHETPLSGEGVAISKIMLKDLIYRHPFSYLKHLLHTLFNQNNDVQQHEIARR